MLSLSPSPTPEHGHLLPNPHPLSVTPIAPTPHLSCSTHVESPASVLELLQLGRPGRILAVHVLVKYCSTCTYVTRMTKPTLIPAVLRVANFGHREPIPCVAFLLLMRCSASHPHALLRSSLSSMPRHQTPGIHVCGLRIRVGFESQWAQPARVQISSVNQHYGLRINKANANDVGGGFIAEKTEGRGYVDSISAMMLLSRVAKPSRKLAISPFTLEGTKGDYYRRHWKRAFRYGALRVRAAAWRMAAREKER